MPAVQKGAYMSNELWRTLEAIFSDIIKSDGIVRYWCPNGRARGGFFRVLDFSDRAVVLQPANGKRRSVRRADFESAHSVWEALKSGTATEELHSKNYNVSYVRSILHLADSRVGPTQSTSLTAV